MRSTSDTKFTIYECGDLTNAFCNMDENLIDIGAKALTTETIVHELGELVNEYLLAELGYSMPYIFKDNKTYYISHIMSPYGINSWIYPTPYTFEESNKEDFDIGKYEELL